MRHRLPAASAIALCVASAVAADTPGGDRMASSEQIHGWIQEFCATDHRRPGTPQDREGAYYIARKFTEFGLEDVRIDPIPLTSWQAGAWRLETNAGGSWDSIPCFYMHYSAFTPPEGIEAEMIYLGPGRPVDARWPAVKGKIVVVDVPYPALPVRRLRDVALYAHDPEGTLPEDLTLKLVSGGQRSLEAAYKKAHASGAAALVAILADVYGNRADWFGQYGTVIKPIPALYVGRDDGARLRESLRGGTLRARLRLTGTKKPGLTSNIVGYAPGTTDDVLIIQCHHDSPFKGGTEDGSGMGIVLALAEFAGSRPRESRRKTWLFVATAGHFYGGIGSTTFLRKHRDDILPRVKAAFVPEHIALEAAEVNGKLALTGHPEINVLWVSDAGSLQDRAVAAVRKHNLTRTHVLPPTTALFPNPIGESGRYAEAGIPVVQLMSGPAYLFTADDTLDKVAVDRLAPTARAFADLIEYADRSLPARQ